MWLETKPENQKYVFVDGDNCACGQYAASIGQPSSERYIETDVWGELNGLAHGQPRTFGALLERALKKHFFEPEPTP